MKMNMAADRAGPGWAGAGGGGSEPPGNLMLYTYTVLTVTKVKIILCVVAAVVRWRFKCSVKREASLSVQIMWPTSLNLLKPSGNFTYHQV
jgi:hypothetical protein